MKKKRILPALPSTVLFSATLSMTLAIVNCGGSDPDPSDQGLGGEASSGGGSASGGASSDSGGSGGGSADGGASTGGNAASGGSTATGGGSADDAGFSIRLPAVHTIECAGGSHEIKDSDWVCTLKYGDINGFVYVKATPVDCVETLSIVPTFDTEAFVSIDGKVETANEAEYDWGGNHHNDSISFEYGGDTYTLYHSSFGWGWHSCTPMDCLQVSEGATGTITEDGCEPTRSLPIVCAEVQSDGTYADLSEDPFEICPGDMM